MMRLRHGHRAGAKALLGIAMLLVLAPLLAATDIDARFSSLGHKMICSCGCNQILLECNHVGCPNSDGMRNELTAALQRGQNDDTILESFVQKYGPTILAAPPAVGFNRLAWVMPFVVLALSFVCAILIIRSWKGSPLSAAAHAAMPSAVIETIRRETDI